MVVITFATSTLGLLPYPYAHPNIKANLVIDVRAQQFQWCLSYYPSWGTECQAAIQIPVGSTVIFNTSSVDVNHGFGLYSSSGQVLDQVQVMPGYYNNIIYQFTTSGTYYIRCLEFCGYGHFGMVGQINVSSELQPSNDLISVSPSLTETKAQEQHRRQPQIVTAPSEALTPYTKAWTRRLLFFSFLNFIIAGTIGLLMRTDQSQGSNLLGPIGSPGVFGQLETAQDLGDVRRLAVSVHLRLVHERSSKVHEEKDLL
ncbi:MAG: hypothetical protein ACRDF4_05545 [Rhabdochlamydiaceae bacterium]